MDLIYSIFDTLYKEIAETGVADKNAYIFLNKRPQTMAEGTGCFVVIDLPSELEPMIIGNDEEEKCNMTYGVIYIYYKSKSNGTLNPKGLTNRINTVRKLFPIKGDYCTCVNPRRQISGSDGYGFHIGTISFRIRTKPIN